MSGSGPDGDEVVGDVVDVRVEAVVDDEADVAGKLFPGLLCWFPLVTPTTTPTTIPAVMRISAKKAAQISNILRNVFLLSLS